MTKFESQGLHIIRIKYWNASGSGFPPFFISAHWNIGILLHKQAKHFGPECRSKTILDPSKLLWTWVKKQIQLWKVIFVQFKIIWIYRRTRHISMYILTRLFLEVGLTWREPFVPFVATFATFGWKHSS